MGNIEKVSAVVTRLLLVSNIPSPNFHTEKLMARQDGVVKRLVNSPLTIRFEESSPAALIRPGRSPPDDITRYPGRSPVK